eukprot:3932323-Prymnesium_polylepis.1
MASCCRFFHHAIATPLPTAGRPTTLARKVALVMTWSTACWASERFATRRKGSMSRISTTAARVIRSGASSRSASRYSRHARATGSQIRRTRAWPT